LNCGERYENMLDHRDASKSFVTQIKQRVPFGLAKNFMLRDRWA